ncbi:aminotransferase class I/II-fold pyridoxal phosphate-dependent enzyme [Macrococcoides caseolyticum]|uniref:Pyridoxal phosphate-dependent aminotransferase n=1 Tax=Macrococcoides caseolyticum TaxID=69966 RepID=A0ACC9MVD4_9STAP|nr:aminotransferase class I/II-fold pyridoxal phosphate-dependent enzyme [Macrococcus caseolyticus]PKE20295.1 pyridoxal phosphate-dependent aminotransferase [Macrococcus caseolyticus]PKE40264.1 pyridoxal phosphate-dependent aminotransferase [Macrococcus caseolyticus]PKE57432.1 pyridoxal phosphate-dependent aminotransferase [Macrococcus caseolyticus]PKF41249.1 pyridoxal phosphate-dependent aminotransferase [Macrococcus caseolyticus]QQB05554.1 DegT/DnrJ/EryC1/StrS family aminotransferase [Macroc
MEERVFLSSPHMGGNEEKYVKEAFDTNWIAPLGENVTQFENAVKSYTGAKAACALSSGTGGLHLALDLLGVGPGDIVFCSSLTFIATANPIMYLGAEPVFIDSDLDSWNMSPYALRKAFEKYAAMDKLPKAVMIVNLYGQSAKMDELMAICNEYNVPVVEDAAESLGSKYHGQMSGTFGKFGIFSFNGNKIITTSGGGMIISDDEEAIAHALKKATQARDNALHYQHSEVGYNYRLSNVSAGIGRGQMEVLDDRVAKKREIFDRYVEGLKGIDGISFMEELEDSFSNRWLSTMIVDSEKVGKTSVEIIEHLAGFNIEARPVWKPMHLQPLFEGKDFIQDELQDVSKFLFENGICLPSDTKMTEVIQDTVIDMIKTFINS